ncbi:DUF2625 family protein [Actinoplanes sp. NPDC051494]|uniref:DUF2625 family protein n=1 Tax=Actinoplanes sp. NPDC051494 TaxID=3363907 RepID=UPI0037A61DA3
MDENAWPEISAAIAGAPYPVDVLPAEPARAAACLTALGGLTTRSWLGAVVASSGGILVDHGWVRVLGSGHDGLPEVIAQPDGVVVAHDVLGGRFAWVQPAPQARPTVHYFGPDALSWLDLDQGYTAWLSAVLSGGLTGFYASLRWPGWPAEVAELDLGQGISAMPPPFTREGRDLSAVSRRPIPMAQLIDLYDDLATQLG